MGALLMSLVPLLTQDLTWWRVERLAPATDVQVALDSGASYRGRFAAADMLSIHLHVGNRIVALERVHVERVSVNRGTHNLRRNVGIGFLVGGLAGGLAHQASCGDQGPAYAESGVTAFYPGAAAGMIVGAVVPSHDWETIYRVP
jgi:hypothetical protein